MAISIDPSRGGDAALDEYYGQSYALTIVRLHSAFEINALARLGAAPAGAWIPFVRPIPTADLTSHFTPRLVRLAEDKRQ